MTFSLPVPVISLLGASRGQVLLELRVKPQTAASLAETLDITRTAVRRHLQALKDVQLVQSHVLYDGSMGRPSEEWALTQSGRSMFVQENTALLNAVLQYVTNRFGADALDDFFHSRASLSVHRQSLQAHSDPIDRIELLVDLVNQDGQLMYIIDMSPEYVVLRQSVCPFENTFACEMHACHHDATAFEDALGLKVEMTTALHQGDTVCDYVIYINEPLAANTSNKPS